MDNSKQCRNDRWLLYSVFPIALWGSFFNLLNFNSYPVFRLEVAIVILGTGIIGLLMGLVQDAARPRLWAPVAAFFTAIVVDLNAPLDTLWFILCWIVLGAIAFITKELFLKILLASSLAVLLFQSAELVFAPETAPSARDEARNRQDLRRTATDRAAIVHLVLDSYLGLDGMALAPDSFRDLRVKQIAFFTDRGFQIYPRAYARNAKTLNSLPTIFSYGGPIPAINAVRADYVIPERLPYFADLDRHGYRIHALMPAYFDVCVRQKLTQCRTFQSSALSSMLGTRMSAADKAEVLGFAMINLAPAARALFDWANPDPQARHAQDRAELFPLTSLGQMDRFIAGLAGLRRGEVRFAHFLLPHDPYMLKPDCTLKPRSAWLDEHGPSATNVREQAYAEQVACLQQQLARLLDVLDRTPAGREAIVVIHGDHGSRIAPSQPIIGGPALSQRELLMSYSTLFAIRVPGEPAGEVAGTFAVAELMADFRARDFASAPRPAPGPGRVIATDPNGQPREWWQLPSFSPQH